MPTPRTEAYLFVHFIGEERTPDRRAAVFRAQPRPARIGTICAPPASLRSNGSAAKRAREIRISYAIHAVDSILWPPI